MPEAQHAVLVQLDLAGKDAPESLPRYDRDEDAKPVKLFEPAPAQMPGQTWLETDSKPS